MRVVRTCRELGIPTVAVYSEADRGARHVREADEAVAIGPAEAQHSYLSIDALLGAARSTGADAIHPGYGFLSQNGDFADAVRDAGLVFVGPPGDVHRRMGDKQAARRLMAAAGVPVLPGYDGDEQDDDRLLAEAERIGWPVMLKPSRGGGGKGMRVVRREPPTSPPLLAASRREARAAFGDDDAGLERYVERPRHVEVQVLADAHGAASCTSASASARSSAGTRRSSRRRPARRCRPRAPRGSVRRGRRRGARGRLRERGHRRVPARADGALLLPRDEHAAAGRAPGDRGGHRARPRAAAARGGGRPRRCPSRSRTSSSRGHALECRLYAEDPRPRRPAVAGPRPAPLRARGARDSRRLGAPAPAAR